MAELIEYRSSRKTDLKSKDWVQTRVYRVSGADEIKDALEIFYSQTESRIVISGALVAIRGQKSVTPIGKGFWEITCEYRGFVPEGSQPQVRWSYSFSGSTSDDAVVQSYQTIWKSEGAPENERYVNIDETGNPQGATVARSGMQFAVNVMVPESEMTFDDVRYLYQFGNKVNSKSFFGFQAGEVLSLAPSGGWKPKSDWNISYPFRVILNQRNIKINVNGKEVTVPALNGHDYINIRRAKKIEVKEQADAANRGQLVVPVNLAAYVERMYDYADLNDIFIGGVIGRKGGGVIGFEVRDDIRAGTYAENWDNSRDV